MLSSSIASFDRDQLLPLFDNVTSADSKTLTVQIIQGEIGSKSTMKFLSAIEISVAEFFQQRDLQVNPDDGFVVDKPFQLSDTSTNGIDQSAARPVGSNIQLVVKITPAKSFGRKHSPNKWMAPSLHAFQIY